MTLLGSTLAHCPECHVNEHARIVAKAGGVFMERLCPRLGAQSVKLASDHRWFLDRTDAGRWGHGAWDPNPSKKGCPFDCGPCQWHSGSIRAPIVPVSGNIDLVPQALLTDDGAEGAHYTPVDGIRTMVSRIVERTGGVPIISLGGTEPTRHPQFFEVLAACRQERVGLILVNTDGLRIAQETGFAQKVKEAGVQLVLTVDSFVPLRSSNLHGRDVTAEKHEALKILERFEIPTSLRVVCYRGVNEDEVASIAHTYLKKEFVQSVTLQNMPFVDTDTQPEPQDHATLDELETLLTSHKGFSTADFFPLSTYHPRCYSVAHVLVVDGAVQPVSGVLDRQSQRRLAENEDSIDPGKPLAAESLFSASNVQRSGERSRMGERFIKAVYVHSYMGRANFEVDRASRCGDLLTDETGSMMPACTFNLLHPQGGQQALNDVAAER